MLRRLVLLGTMLLIVSGCGVFVAPSPTAREMGDVVAALVLRNATITDQVAGDDGCGDPSLHSNAVRLDIAMGAQSSIRPVYLFRWRRQSDYDASATAFDSCVAAFKDAHPDQEVMVVDVAPWRAYGTDWSDELRNAVDQALRETGGAS